MEIRIKTQDEFLAGHVTIEIRADQAEVPDSVADLSAAELAAQVDSLEIQLEACRQERADLNSEIARWADNFNASQEKVQELQATVREYDLDRTTERNRADGNKDWAERAEAQLVESRELAVHNKGLAERAELELARSITEARAKLKDRQNRIDEAEQQISGMTARTGKINSALNRPLIAAVLSREWSSWTESEAAALTVAIRDARQALGTPLS